MPSADRAALAAAAGEYSVESGTALTTEGDFGHGFFAIEYGTADVFRDGTHVATLGPGDVFGEPRLGQANRVCRRDKPDAADHALQA